MRKRKTVKARNPIAKEVTKIPPKVVQSKKNYKRKKVKDYD